MNLGTLRKVKRLVAEVSNPLHLLLDWLDKANSPYILHLRSGATMELRPHRGDLDAFRAVWLSRAYLGPEDRLRAGDVVVDIGANIGCFTLLAATEVGPTGRVVAVEPDAETFSRLERNIALSQLHNVTAVRAAITDAEGTVELRTPSNCAYASLFTEVDGRENGGSVQQVPALTLDRLFDRYGIDRCDFLKLDCEGAEHAIFRSMTTETASRIRQIGLELHSVEGFSSQELLRRLHGFGFMHMERDRAILRFRRTSRS